MLAGARCLLFPIQWEEPFGMVMIEAMACGTPVVALRGGAVPEVIVDGVTGVVCDRPDELPAAIERAQIMDPVVCRRHVAAHFGVAQFGSGYERSIGRWSAPPCLPADRPIAAGSARAVERRGAGNRMTAPPTPFNSGDPVNIGFGGATVTLVEGATFCLSDGRGDVLAGRSHGLFVRDARVLSRWELRVDGQPAEPLSVQARNRLWRNSFCVVPRAPDWPTARCCWSGSGSSPTGCGKPSRCTTLTTRAPWWR